MKKYLIINKGKFKIYQSNDYKKLKSKYKNCIIRLLSKSKEDEEIGFIELLINPMLKRVRSNEITHNGKFGSFSIQLKNIDEESNIIWQDNNKLLEDFYINFQYNKYEDNILLIYGSKTKLFNIIDKLNKINKINIEKFIKDNNLNSYIHMKPNGKMILSNETHCKEFYEKFSEMYEKDLNNI